MNPVTQLLRAASLAVMMILLTVTGVQAQRAKAIAVVGAAPKGVVEYQPVDGSWKALSFGTLLNDGDRVRTGEEGFVALVFTDDGSQLKVRPNTSLELSAERRDDTSLAKRVNMEIGELFAEVKQQKGSLQIATPTAVASVKGTEFWVLVQPDGTTTQITLEGLVDLLSLITGEQVDVPPGNQGIIDPDTGEIDLGEVPVEDVPQFLDQMQVEDIEIRFLDANGNEKTLIIQYKIQDEE